MHVTNDKQTTQFAITELCIAILQRSDKKQQVEQIRAFVLHAHVLTYLQKINELPKANKKKDH